jgi:predicted dehydrogenase
MGGDGRVLRGAVIGCGFFAGNHLNAWAAIEGVRIVAVCDRDPGRLEAAGERFGVAGRYADAGALFAGEELDFVDIVTTVPSHRGLVEMAASHGVAAVCQKPFAESQADALAMVAAMERAGVALMVHENFRWERPIMAARDVIAAGRIGVPFWARVSFRTGFDVVAGQPYLAQGERFVIADLGVHVLDVARFLLGEVESVSARTARVDPRVRGEDVATMLLGHVSGAASVVEASYSSRFVSDPFPQTLIDVEGSEGSVRLGAGYGMTVVDAGGSEVVDVSPALLPWAERPWHGVQESVLAIQEHWVGCLRSGAEPATSGRDNLRTSALVEAAYESAASGMTVRVA